MQSRIIVRIRFRCGWVSRTDLADDGSRDAIVQRPCRDIETSDGREWVGGCGGLSRRRWLILLTLMFKLDETLGRSRDVG